MCACVPVPASLPAHYSHYSMLTAALLEKTKIISNFILQRERSHKRTNWRCKFLLIEWPFIKFFSNLFSESALFREHRRLIWRTRTHVWTQSCPPSASPYCLCICSRICIFNFEGKKTQNTNTDRLLDACRVSQWTHRDAEIHLALSRRLQPPPPFTKHRLKTFAESTLLPLCSCVHNEFHVPFRDEASAHLLREQRRRGKCTHDGNG